MFRELLVAALCECFMRDRPLNDDRTIFGSSLERIGREIVSCYFSFLATITVGLGGMYHDALLVIIRFIWRLFPPEQHHVTLTGLTSLLILYVVCPT